MSPERDASEPKVRPRTSLGLRSAWAPYAREWQATQWATCAEPNILHSVAGRVNQRQRTPASAAPVGLDSGSMPGPTGFPELNAVLAELVASVKEILGENFCGAYLQGSFALGDADEHSDVDFVIVTAAAVEAEQLRELQAMHRRIHALAVPWAQHLEGSYISKGELRHVDRERKPLPFLDNGASELELDNHCNTAVVRRVLRERGVTLEGPDPKTLIAPIGTAELRREGIAAIREHAEWAPARTKAGGMSRWKQTYLVLIFCRILHQLESGEVGSKRQAGEWAQVALDAEWRDLIGKAVADRADPWRRVQLPADPGDVERTLAFADYATAVSGRYESDTSRQSGESH
jgi:hypothetical protein